MEPALGVAALLLLFAGTHVGLASRRLRSALLGQLGEVGFTVLFSAIALATFAALMHQYAVHRFEGAPGLALGEVAAARWLLMAVIVTGVTLAVAGVVVFPRSPMALFADAGAPPRGLERITRHPFLVGMALVGAGHALLATRMVGTVAFGGLAVFAIIGAWHQDRKLLLLRGRPYGTYMSATSALPFGAVLAGRQKVVWRELPGAALAMGLAAAFGLRAAHGGILSAGGAWVIGVTAALPLVLGFEAWQRVRHAGRTPARLAGDGARQ
jgi:uncharacterized membrane protein